MISVTRVPLRMCIVCRAMKPKNQLLRVTANENGEIFPDISGKFGGRGAYICTNSDCSLKLNNNKCKALERAFKRGIHTHEKENIMKELVK